MSRYFAWGARIALCFFLHKYRLFLPPASAALEPVNSRAAGFEQSCWVKFNLKEKKKNHSVEWFLFLAPQVGLEPTTLRLTVPQFVFYFVLFCVI